MNSLEENRKVSSALVLFENFFKKVRRRLRQEAKQNDATQNSSEGKIKFEMIKMYC